MTKEMTEKRTQHETVHPERARRGRAYVPNADIIENDDEFLVLADVPGVKAGNVDVTYEQGILEIHAQVEPRRDEARTNYLLREYGVGDYYRSFRLGGQIDVAGIQAELKNGVLTLHLPKATPAKRKQIEVKAM